MQWNEIDNDKCRYYGRQSCMYTFTVMQLLEKSKNRDNHVQTFNSQVLHFDVWNGQRSIFFDSRGVLKYVEFDDRNEEFYSNYAAQLRAIQHIGAQETTDLINKSDDTLWCVHKKTSEAMTNNQTCQLQECEYN